MYFKRHEGYKVVLYPLSSSEKSTGHRKAENSNSSQGQPWCIIESGDYFKVVLSEKICKVKSSKYSHFSTNSQKTKFMTPERWKGNKFSPSI